MVLGSTLFPHKSIHKITWVSPDNRTQSQIDHFAISRRWRTSLLDVRNKRGADINSDHYLIVARVRVKIKKQEERYKQQIRRCDTKRLKNKSYKRGIQTKTSE